MRTCLRYTFRCHCHSPYTVLLSATAIGLRHKTRTRCLHASFFSIFSADRRITSCPGGCRRRNVGCGGSSVRRRWLPHNLSCDGRQGALWRRRAGSIKAFVDGELMAAVGWRRETGDWGRGHTVAGPTAVNRCSRCSMLQQSLPLAARSPTTQVNFSLVT